MVQKKQPLVAWNVRVSKGHKAKAAKRVKEGKAKTQSEYVRNLIDADNN